MVRITLMAQLGGMALILLRKVFNHPKPKTAGVEISPADFYAF